MKKNDIEKKALRLKRTADGITRLASLVSAGSVVYIIHGIKSGKTPDDPSLIKAGQVTVSTALLAGANGAISLISEITASTSHKNKAEEVEEVIAEIADLDLDKEPEEAPAAE